MMKIAISIFLYLVSLLVTFAAGSELVSPKPGAETNFHQPFTLKLHVNKNEFYEERFEKVPFVDAGNIYLFKDDQFGVKLNIQENAILYINYEPNLKRADLTVKFTQVINENGTAIMVLNLHNNTQYNLNLDAMMTIPGRKSPAKTTVLPVRPGLSTYESWPHPIVQLVLRNLRVSK